jgi:hypothetical protein
MASKSDDKQTPLNAIRRAERKGQVPSDQRLPKQQVQDKKSGKLVPEKRTSATPRKGEEPRKRGASNSAVRTGQSSTAARNPANQYTKGKKGK